MKNLVEYIKGVRFELSKIEWPTFVEFVTATAISIFLIVILSIYLGSLDALFQWGAKSIFASFAR